MSQDSSVITVQDNVKFEKMEESMKAMQKRLTELQQEQVNQTMGPRDLVNYMESSNSNLIDKLASQSKRARSPEIQHTSLVLIGGTQALAARGHMRAGGWGAAGWG